MANLGKTMWSGFLATVVLSILMIAKAKMGMMPHLDLIAMLARMLGDPGVPIIGWLAHFTVGTLFYGIAFALLAGKLPGTCTVQGMILAIMGWLVMMIVIMPMAGAGLFGLGLGIAAPIATLVLHLVFGAVLGAVYGRLGTTRILEAG